MSYFISDFDRVCGRLHGLIRACISESFVFNVAVPFKAALSQRQHSVMSLQNCINNKVCNQTTIRALKTRSPKTGTLENSEDPDEMPHYYAAFHQGLHCLLRQNQSSEKEIL